MPECGRAFLSPELLYIERLSQAQGQEGFILDHPAQREVAVFAKLGREMVGDHKAVPQ